MNKYQIKARETYIVGTPIDEFAHPEIIAECEAMNREAEAARKAQEEADRARVKEVVASVEDLEEQMKGKIVIYSRFNGTVAKTKSMSRSERELVAKAGAAIVGMDKPLFNEFKALDALTGQIATWREKIKEFGIPFYGRGMTVIDIRLIPAVEALFDDIDRQLPELVSAMVAAYPEAIEGAKALLESKGVGELFNPRDYRPAGEIEKLFSLTRKWMPSFDVPDILKEVDMERWEAERKRSAALWAEVRQNGVNLLREQVAELTDRLVESVTGKEDGTKKKFYATTLTNIEEFFATFQNRNLAGDKGLEEQVRKLKSLIEGRNAEDFKNSDALRLKVRTNGAAIQQALKGMLVDSTARVITFRNEE